MNLLSTKIPPVTYLILAMAFRNSPIPTTLKHLLTQFTAPALGFDGFALSSKIFSQFASSGACLCTETLSRRCFCELFQKIIQCFVFIEYFLLCRLAHPNRFQHAACNLPSDTRAMHIVIHKAQNQYRRGFAGAPEGTTARS